MTCLLVDPEHFSKSDCRFYKRAEVHRGGSWALQRSWWRSWLFFSRSLRAECWGSICCLSIPKHNRIFMKAISTCLNRNDFDLTIIYISIWVVRAQWELPYILCVSQEWMWGEAANITVSKKLPFKYSITVFVMILSSVQFQEKDFLLQKQTIQKCFILNFFFSIFSITVIHENLLPSTVSLQDNQTVFNSDGLLWNDLPWTEPWTALNCLCLPIFIADSPTLWYI